METNGIDLSDPEADWVEGTEHHFVEANGIRLHYVEAGSGPLVILLHGFPDFWYSWRRQILALAEAGFRVVAPDMRGYNRSDQPRSVRSYRPEILADDVAALIPALGERSASVVGHDWGGAVAWYFAMRNPPSLERVVILNCPHPTTMLKKMYRPRQLARSWYMFFFQIPRLPEVALGVRGHEALRRTYKRMAKRDDTFAPLDIERYIEAADRSRNFRGGINYYRAAFRRNPFRAERNNPRIESDTLVLWGENDPSLGRELAEPHERLVSNLRIRRFGGAGHWVHLDEPDVVNSELVGFLR